VAGRDPPGWQSLPRPARSPFVSLFLKIAPLFPILNVRSEEERLMSQIANVPLPAREYRLKAVGPWIVLVGWLAVAAAQLWSLQVEAVVRGEVCSAQPVVALWGGRQ